MGFYMLPDEVHKEMDKIRSKFFSQGTGIKFKYHMVKWRAVCRPKNYGGLGVSETRTMNICLIVKWILKIINNREQDWCRLLYMKYTKKGEFF